MQVEQLVCNRQEQQCTAGAACNLRDGSQRAYLRVERLHLPSWQKMAREIANCWRSIFSYFCQKPMMETNLPNCWRCSYGNKIVQLEKSSIRIRIKICLFGCNLTFKNEKNIPLEQIVPLEQNRKKIFH